MQGCTNNGSESLRLVEVVAELKSEISKLKNVSNSFKAIKEVEIPKINRCIASLQVSHSKLEDRYGD